MTKIEMKRKKNVLAACLFILSSIFLFAREEQVITIETEPADCQVKVYEWAPCEGNKGDIIAEGKSPLKFPEEVSKSNRGIVITVETREEGYLNSEQTFFAPYKFSLNRVKVTLQKDYVYLARKAEEQRRGEERRKAELERQRAEAIRIQKEVKDQQAKKDIKKAESPVSAPFEILEPKKLIKMGGYTQRLMDNLIDDFAHAIVEGSVPKRPYQSTSNEDAYTERVGVSFSVKNISSSAIRKCFFKIVYAYESNEQKVFLGEDISSIENLPPGYSTPTLQSWAESVGTTQSTKVLTESRLSEWKKYRIRLFWSENLSGSWKEIPNFSEILKIESQR